MIIDESRGIYHADDIHELDEIGYLDEIDKTDEICVNYGMYGISEIYPLGEIHVIDDIDVLYHITWYTSGAEHYVPLVNIDQGKASNLASNRIIDIPS